MHSPWLQQLLEQPGVFLRWFDFLRYPSDLFRSISFIFELVLYSRMDIKIHPDYLEVFSTPDSHDNDALRIRRNVLLPADSAFVDALEEARKDVFAKVTIVPAGRKYIYSQFKLGALDIDRLRLLTVISSHLLSCQPTAATLQVLSRVARVLCPDTLYPQFCSTELHVKLMSLTSLRCPECGRIDSKHAVPRMDWETRFARLYSFAADLLEANPEFDPENAFMYRLHACKQALLNHIEGGAKSEPRIEAIGDRLLLGHPPVSAFVMPRLEGPPEKLTVVRQDCLDSPYGGKMPTGGSPVYYHNALSIYPTGQYGGQACVVLAPGDRYWQHSRAIFEAATTDRQGGGPFVPLFGALWTMIEQGDLDLLTRIIQHWTISGTHGVPDRCLDRDNWRNLSALLPRVQDAVREDIFTMMDWTNYLVRFFVDDNVHFCGEVLADDRFWTKALADGNMESLGTLTRKRVHTPQISRPVPIAYTTKTRGSPSVPVFGNIAPDAPQREWCYGYSRRPPSGEMPLLARFFYHVECGRRGMSQLKVQSYSPPPNIKKKLFLEDTWVSFYDDTHGGGYVPTRVGDLTVIARGVELPYPLPLIPPRPVFDCCAQKHARRRPTGDDDSSRSATSSAVLVAERRAAEEAAIKQMRAEAREHLQNLAAEAEDEPYDGYAALQKKYGTVMFLGELLEAAGVEGVGVSLDGELTDGKRRRYTVDKNNFVVEGGMAFPFNEQGARAWASQS
jgi:hypothetical protein